MGKSFYVLLVSGAISLVGLQGKAQAQAFPEGITAWGTLGVAQTENAAQCSFGSRFGNTTQDTAVPYAAHIVNSGSGSYSIDFTDYVATTTPSVANTGATIEFSSTGTAGLLVAGAGSVTGPVALVSVSGSYGGGPIQQGGLLYLNLAFFYSANGADCGAQISGTFFAEPLGG